MSHMTQLALSLFGAITAAPPLRLPTDKTRALLAYLTLHPDTPLRREALANLLWPDQPEELARQNLRKTIGRLKQALDEAEPNLAEAVLAITRESIALRGAHTTADVLTFRAHLAAVRSHPHATLAHCPTCHMRLQAAVALTQRGEFLAGLTLPDAPPFDEWLLIQRENLYQQQLAALHQLAQTYEAQGAWEPALQCAHAQIALEPWREEAHRQAMRLLASHGRRTEAIAQYQTCRQILQDELGVEPTAETEALLAQIRAGGLERETAALSPTAERLHHFPTLFEPLIGREAETAQIAAQLAEPTCRLLTITGQGGMGKTSLATAVGQALALQPVFADGLYFIPLEGVETAERLVLAIGQGLGLVLQSQQTSYKQLAAHLRHKQVLLVLDNFEQLVGEGATVLSDLLATTETLTLLVTSREPLNIRPERRFVLAGLSFPAEGELAQPEVHGAVRLFEQVGQRVQPRFAVGAHNEAAVGRIGRLVQGIPLAIELAAHWLRLMDAAQIGTEIGRNLDFLASNLRDVPERHRSMRVVFEQSWSQLTPAEQQLLARLSVFRGGFALADGLAITRPPSPVPTSELATLLDKSLVHRTPHGRYTLHELIRQFAAEKLADAGEIQRQHSLHYLAQLRDCGPQFLGSAPHVAQAAVQQELDNMMAAWETAVAQHLWEALGEAIQPWVDYYEMAGTFAEGLSLFNHAATQLAALPEPAPAQKLVLGYVQAQAAWFMYVVGSSKEARPLAENALAIGQQLGHEHLQAVALYRLGLVAWRLNEQAESIALLTEAYHHFRQLNDTFYAISVAGNLSFRHGRLNQDEADLAYAREAYLLAQSHPSVFALATALDALSYYYERRGQLAEAIHYREQADGYFRQAQWHQGLAIHQISLGNIYLRQGELAKALATCQSSLAFYQKTGNVSSMLNLQSNIANVYARQGEYDVALAMHQEVLATCQKLDNRWGMLLSLILIGQEQARRNLLAEAAVTYEQAWQLAEAMQAPQKQAQILSGKAVLATHHQKWAEAEHLLTEALRIDTEIDNKQGQAMHHYHWGLLYLAQGEKEAATRPLALARALYEELQDSYRLAQVVAALG
ncbi:MAG: BTAD domain-containing putative transcriptional regulator [Chloroflexi bacterium]|nr:BTAD domain-containing putative transcriptional regulator [Chloroflexota bacterium]